LPIIRIEQLYPLHLEKISKLLGKYKEIRWVQDEPQNMGAWEYLRLALAEYPLRYFGRERSGATATGSHKQHLLEQERFMNEAFHD
jgi:2-oxoglutarate dehydrogenase E1 component